MVIINLRDYYPAYKTDKYIEVPDEIVSHMEQWDRDEKAYRRKRNRYQAYYSLDNTKFTQSDILFVSIKPDEHYERLLTNKQLYKALSLLPEKQAKRIIAHYILGISQTDIARAEEVCRSVIHSSIQRGLKNLAIILKKFSK